MPFALRTAAARAAVSLFAAVAAAGLLLAGVPGPVAHADPASQLQDQLAAKGVRERNLRSGIAADASQISRYQGPISIIEARLASVQTALDRTVAQLAATRAQEQVDRIHLQRLEDQLAYADRALAQDLVASYESNPPDWLTVVLNAHGFADLIERVDFLNRVKLQNAQVIAADRRARERVIAEADRLGALQLREDHIKASVLAQRDQISSLRIQLVGRQLVFIRARDAKAGALATTVAERRRLEGSLAALIAAQAQAQARALAPTTTSSGPVSTGPVLSGGGFTFPLPGGSAVAPGSWSEDQGVDIAAPGDTPELAVGAGTIVLHGIGGFGPWAPVLHLDSPLGGQSYVYYGHAGPQGELPIGTHVGAGAVIGSIGPGIVGMSTGPHLEIGFADGSGTPISGTAGLMMSLLQGSYHG